MVLGKPNPFSILKTYISSFMFVFLREKFHEVLDVVKYLDVDYIGQK